MADGGIGEAALIISAISGVAGTTAGIVQAQDQKRSARIAADRQRQALEAQKLKEKNQETITAQEKLRDDERARQRALAGTAQGRAATILSTQNNTSPSSAPTGKSLLGV